MTPWKVAYDDQYRAAVSEVHRLLDATARRTGSAVGRSEAGWLQAKFHEFGRTLLAGKGTFCPHIGRSPMVAHTAAWATDHLVCPSCIDLLEAIGGTERRCDRCGQRDQLHAGCAAHGPVLMAYGLCLSCVRLA
ncbi:hypothetical protein DFJ69_4503 [Thermomonospora umbrina]|uniref:Uncharacterized protein n=1 Tax=Thermomonospora umbrina TaxID=111806 RepID=A0A3D9SY80_9ACTN|nr:hypothetical protein DFJ69_4503 [Thermomonospora umbrina]